MSGGTGKTNWEFKKTIRMAGFRGNRGYTEPRVRFGRTRGDGGRGSTKDVKIVEWLLSEVSTMSLFGGVAKGLYGGEWRGEKEKQQRKQRHAFSSDMPEGGTGVQTEIGKTLKLEKEGKEEWSRKRKSFPIQKTRDILH